MHRYRLFVESHRFLFIAARQCEVRQDHQRPAVFHDLAARIGSVARGERSRTSFAEVAHFKRRERLKEAPDGHGPGVADGPAERFHFASTTRNERLVTLKMVHVGKTVKRAGARGGRDLDGSGAAEPPFAFLQQSTLGPVPEHRGRQFDSMLFVGFRRKAPLERCTDILDIDSQLFEPGQLAGATKDALRVSEAREEILEMTTAYAISCAIVCQSGGSVFAESVEQAIAMLTRLNEVANHQRLV